MPEKNLQIPVGTSGYPYKEWVGKFYPEKLPANAMPRYYAEPFPTVEINNSFYRMPAETMRARWAAREILPSQRALEIEE